MKPTICIILGTALGTILTGCTTSQTTQTTEGPKPSTTINRHASPATSTSRPVPGDPYGELTILTAAGLALARSPDLEAYRRENQRALALERQAGIWDNPELEVEFEEIRNDAETPDGRALETTVAFSQRLPLGRDAAFRRRMAEARSEGAHWEFEAARLETLLLVNRRFVLALAADRRLELADRELELASQTRNVIRQLVETGKASPVELTRIEVPVVEAELSRQRQARLQAAAYRQLALTWGSWEATFAKAAGDLEQVPPLPEPSDLVRMINSNPSVAGWGAAVSEQVAARRLARAEAIPDPTLRIGIKERDEPDEETFIVGIRFPLPIFDRKQGDLTAAREGEAAARARQSAEELRLQGMLNEAYAGLANAHDEVAALRERALPAAEKGFSATQLAYAEGKLGLLDVLDAQRTLFELESRYLDALVDCHLWAAEIESLIGQPLGDLAP